MMGRPHALSGAAAWLAAAPAIAHFTPVDFAPAVYLAGAVVTAGAALAPDLDHGSNSYARGSLGPITRAVSNVVALGGHRKLTHSFAGVGIACALLAAGMSAPVFTQASWAGPLASLVPLATVFFLLAFALAAAAIPPYRISPGVRFLARAGIAAAATAGIAVIVEGDWGWLMLACPLGFLVHILGDAITIAGVPWLWPLGRDYRIARLQAGGPTERYILTPVFVIIIMVCLMFGIKDGQVFGFSTDARPQATNSDR